MFQALVALLFVLQLYLVSLPGHRLFSKFSMMGNAFSKDAYS